MKFECAKDKLKTAVGIAERITGKNLNLPILASVLLSFGKNSLTVRSTNLELGVELVVSGRSSGEGEAVISGGLLFNFLSNLGDNQISLEVVSGNLVISSAQHKTTLKGYPSADFPTLPRVDDGGGSFNLSKNNLVSALQSVAYSASPSSVKPEISSICIYNHDGELVAVATDSFRLAEKLISRGVKIELPKNTLIIPIKNAVEISRALDAAPIDDVLIGFNRDLITFSANQSSFYLTSRLVDGIYPDYRQIIPATKSTSVVVDRADLLESLKLLNVFIDKFNQMTVIISPEDGGGVKLSADGPQGGSSSFLSARVEGGGLEIVLNTRYFLDCFQSITADSLSLGFNGPHKPVVVRGEGDASFTYLIMPINR